MARIDGTDGADRIFVGSDAFNLISAGAGDDLIFAGPGRDFAGGGDGFDTFVTGIAYADGANLSFSGDRYIVGGPNGDIAVGVERFIFTDTVVLVEPQRGLEGAVALPFTKLNPIQDALRAVLRTDTPDLFAEQTALAIRSGQLTFSGYLDLLVQNAQHSTTPAILMQAAVFGTIPTSEKLDSLAQFARAQYDYYANTLKSAFAELGPYEALGRGLASTVEFSSAFAAASDPAFIDASYGLVFGRAATATQHDALLAQVTYFEGLYRNAGIPAAQADLEAKGAVYGQMIGHAAADPSLGYTAIANAILRDFALGDTSHYGAVFGA